MIQKKSIKIQTATWKLRAFFWGSKKFVRALAAPPPSMMALQHPSLIWIVGTPTATSNHLYHPAPLNQLHNTGPLTCCCAACIDKDRTIAAAPAAATAAAGLHRDYRDEGALRYKSASCVKQRFYNAICGSGRSPSVGVEHETSQVLV